jgi:hypothetical protein
VVGIDGFHGVWHVYGEVVEGLRVGTVIRSILVLGFACKGPGENVWLVLVACHDLAYELFEWDRVNLVGGGGVAPLVPIGVEVAAPGRLAVHPWCFQHRHEQHVVLASDSDQFVEWPPFPLEGSMIREIGLECPEADDVSPSGLHLPHPVAAVGVGDDVEATLKGSVVAEQIVVRVADGPEDSTTLQEVTAAAGDESSASYFSSSPARRGSQGPSSPLVQQSEGHERRLHATPQEVLAAYLAWLVDYSIRSFK